MELAEMVSILVDAGMEPEQATALAGGSQQVKLTASGLIKILVVAQDRMTIELPEKVQVLYDQLENLVENARSLALDNAALQEKLNEANNRLKIVGLKPPD